MSPALATFLFEAANFLLLAAALGWLLFRPVRRALDAERERRAAEERAGAQAREEAEEAARQARAAREAGERELAERRREVLAAAREEAARILEEARKERAAERRALERELEAARAAEAGALADVMGRVAAGSVEQLLGALQGPSLDLALVRAACAELAALPGAARGPALVESARPLEAEAGALLAGALGARYEARVVTELGAGVRVTTPAGQVDATPASFGRRAARAVSGAAAEAEGASGAEHPLRRGAGDA